MYSSVYLIVSLLSIHVGVAFSTATSHLDPRNDDLPFCYGKNSICESSNTLHNKCDAFETQSDPTQWYQCLCANGWVSATLACKWCDLAFGETTQESLSFLSSINVEQCSRYSATLAPIPSSVLAAYSSHNATFTGTVPGVTAFPAVVTSTSSTLATKTSGSVNGTAKTSSNGVSTQTLYGGGNGAASSTSTVAPSSTATTSAKSGAEGRRTARRSLFYVFVMLGAVLFTS